MLSALYHDIPGSNLGALACAPTCKRALNQVSQLESRRHYVGHWRDYYRDFSRPAAGRPAARPRRWAAGSFRSARVADRGKTADTSAVYYCPVSRLPVCANETTILTPSVKNPILSLKFTSVVCLYNVAE
jgi:hypothetical protein